MPRSALTYEPPVAHLFYFIVATSTHKVKHLSAVVQCLPNDVEARSYYDAGGRDV